MTYRLLCLIGTSFLGMGQGSLSADMAKKSTVENESLRLQLVNPCYDGISLKGVLLVSLIEGVDSANPRVDPSMWENVQVIVREVTDCFGTSVAFRRRDVLISGGSTAERCVELDSDEWRGREFESSLFSDRTPGPPCIRATILFRPRCGQKDVQSTVKVTRSRRCG